MPIELTARSLRNARPIWPVSMGGAEGTIARLSKETRAWAEANRFSGEAGETLLVPSADGGIAGVLFGTGDPKSPSDALAAGALAGALPPGEWEFASQPPNAELALSAILFGDYRFERYLGKPRNGRVLIKMPAGIALEAVTRAAKAVASTRDLINTPASDMGPPELEAAVAVFAKSAKAKLMVIRGEGLLKANFPMIHAVGRASSQAPRLLDVTWGRKSAPKVTLVGKGVCFDTGGLDIKPSSGMLLMKKDMGGAANVLGLASLIVARKLDVRLRVLIPAVENAIAGNAFRPGDILRSRKGTTVEIGNTDAEGRLVLADALTLASEEDPDLLIDMATLTGAARVALGPDLPPFYTGSDVLAAAIASASERVADPVWRMPLYAPYAKKLKSNIADMNNVTTDGFAGSITAALFLAHFVHDQNRWVHFDIFGWNPVKKHHAPVGGEAQAIRALDKVLADRYG
jgi:leucyl aminopeptidase